MTLIGIRTGVLLMADTYYRKQLLISYELIAQHLLLTNSSYFYFISIILNNWDILSEYQRTPSKNDVYSCYLRTNIVFRLLSW